MTGAGDTVVSAMAAGLASQVSLENSTRLANVAAGLVVGKVGTATVTRESFRVPCCNPVCRDLPAFGVVTEQEAVAAVARLRRKGSES